MKLRFLVSSWRPDTQTHSGILPTAVIGADFMQLVPAAERDGVAAMLSAAAWRTWCLGASHTRRVDRGESKRGPAILSVHEYLAATAWQNRRWSPGPQSASASLWNASS